MWESYKSYIIGGISLIVLEALLIFGLVSQSTRRRPAETQLGITLEAVRESERRFRLVANTAPVLIWMSGPDKLYNYFNQTWLEFTGRPLEAESGNGWSDAVHPEDLKSYQDTYTLAFDLRESFKIQFRLRRFDGEYRCEVFYPELMISSNQSWRTRTLSGVPVLRDRATVWLAEPIIRLQF